MNLWLLLCAAALLGVERVCYIVIWRAPDAFRSWCRRPRLPRESDPVDVLARLFYAFKGLQLAVFLGWCYVYGDGTLRPMAGGGWAPSFGVALMLAGQALNVSVFARLGRVGVFYGNKLGHDVPRCRGFPFSWFRHPQYVGTVMTIWGFFLLMRFPADDWLMLPALETLYYIAGAFLEQDRQQAVTAS